MKQAKDEDGESKRRRKSRSEPGTVQARYESRPPKITPESHAEPAAGGLK